MALPSNTIEAVLSHIGSSTTGVDTTGLSLYVEGAVGFFEGETGVRISSPVVEASSIVEVHGGELRIQIKPLVELVSVEWSTWPAGDNWSVLDADTYVQSGRSVVFNIPLVEGWLRVTYNEGYDDFTNVPYNIRLLICEVAGISYRDRKVTRPPFSPTQDEPARSSIPAKVWRTLNLYRNGSTA